MINNKKKDDYKLIKLIGLAIILLVVIPLLPLSEKQKDGLQSLSVLALGGFEIVNPAGTGELYYGCTSPVSESDCIYYGTKHYTEKKGYINVENIECHEKDWGIECTFIGDKS
jgi:hypothetical protein